MRKINSFLFIAVMIFFIFIQCLLTQSVYKKKQSNIKVNEITPKVYIISDAKWKKWTRNTLNAVNSAVSLWSSSLIIKNAKIHGSKLSASANCIKAPSIYSHTYALMLDKKIPESISKDIAKAISQLWSDWQKSITIPSLPLYPTFISYCGPVAPPTKNIPYRFELFTSSQFSRMSNPNSLKNLLRRNTGNKYKSAYYQKWINTLSKEFSKRFKVWISKVLVKKLMGTGPIPTYVPRYKPCGEVINGYVLPAPGILTAVKF